jgi:predicted lysophospholipase L1 biosynthesis ABC-type transport system permease subunit
MKTTAKKTTESVTEILIVFVLVSAFCAGLFALVIWVSFHDLLWTGIIGGAIFAFLLATLCGMFYASKRRVPKP